MNQRREDRFTCHAAQNDNYIVISLWILLGSILAVIFVLTGIMENVLASQKRRLRKWMCTSVMIVSGHKRAAVRNCTVSAGHLMMSHSELIRASVWQFRKPHCSTGHLLWKWKAGPLCCVCYTPTLQSLSSFFLFSLFLSPSKCMLLPSEWLSCIGGNVVMTVDLILQYVIESNENSLMVGLHLVWRDAVLQAREAPFRMSCGCY